MKKLVIYSFSLISILFFACEKETSQEGDGTVKYATGTLLDSVGNCMQIAVQGNYKKDTLLNESNVITAQVSFTGVGFYTIYSDTVNGYYFYAKGYTYSPIQQPITLKGFGKPLAAKDTKFTLHFNSSSCYFTVKDYIPFLNNGNNDDYFPTTNYSYWTYDNNFINDTAYTTVLPSDKNINGNTYRMFYYKIPLLGMKDTLYYRKDGAGNYYRYDTIASGTKAEYSILKDYASVGTTWESPIVQGTWQSNPTNVKYLFTLLRKNVKRTYGANTFDSVIIVRSETQYFISGAYQSIDSIEYSFSKKVGLVQINKVGGMPLYTAPLKSWKVN